jgi:hypothetical protein
MSHPSFPGKVIIWKEGTLASEDVTALASYLRSKLKGIEVVGPYEVWEGVAEAEVDPVARILAGLRVFKIDSPLEKIGEKPLAGEVAVEERMIRGISEPAGMLYDALLLAGTYSSSISASAIGKELDPESLHIVLTYRMIGTFERYDRRYHARVSCYAFPSIISTTGLVVAPAKPREYYLTKTIMRGGLSEQELLKAIEGRYLDHDDERTTDVLKGYFLQALFYHASGNPFCEDPSCRLYNAHWQEEMLTAQLSGDHELCRTHRQMLGS